MPLDLMRFAALRPKLYHLTASENAERIQREQQILSAARLSAAAKHPIDLREKRSKGIWVDVAGKRVHIRDQAPLHEGNVALEKPCSFEDFVEHLNRHVYFWPGNDEAPIEYGKRHFKRYRDTDPSVRVLRFDTCEVFAANAAVGPRFCKYNSGCPRQVDGRKSPRGLQTFRDSAEFDHRCGEVVEVTFLDRVKLVGCQIESLSAGDFV